MQYFVEPHVDVNVAPPAKGSTLFRYTYTVRFGEKKTPLSHLVLHGLADAAVENWSGDFDECYVLPTASAQVVSCWMQPSHYVHARDRAATITLTSPRAPGVGWYVAGRGGLGWSPAGSRLAVGDAEAAVLCPGRESTAAGQGLDRQVGAEVGRCLPAHPLVERDPFPDAARPSCSRHRTRGPRWNRRSASAWPDSSLHRSSVGSPAGGVRAPRARP